MFSLRLVNSKNVIDVIYALGLFTASCTGILKVARSDFHNKKLKCERTRDEALLSVKNDFLDLKDKLLELVENKQLSKDTYNHLFKLAKQMRKIAETIIHRWYNEEIGNERK